MIELQSEKCIEHLSISLLRDFVLCHYRLHWRTTSIKPQEKSTLLLGKIIHSIIQLAYYQVPLQEAHRLIWQDLAGLYLDELEQWYRLDQEVSTVKEQTSRARHAKKGIPEADRFEEDLMASWQAAHPEYKELQNMLLEYQMDVFPDMQWVKGRSLLDCYRWSCVLLSTPPEEILLPDPICIEGQYRNFEGKSPEDVVQSVEQGEGPGYHLLRGTLPGVSRPIVGVPDVISCDYILDYKVTDHVLDEHELAMDGQLMLYVHLARQRKILRDDQPKRVGHRYVTNRGIRTVWAPTTLFNGVVDQLAGYFIELEHYLDNPQKLLPVRGIPSPFVSPCKWCDWKQFCVPRQNPFAGAMLDDLEDLP